MSSGPQINHSQVIAAEKPIGQLVADPSFVQAGHSAALARAYLAARRKKPTGSIHVTVVQVVSTGRAVDFGIPADWAEGVASGVLSGKYRVVDMVYDPVAVEQLPPSLSSTRRLAHPKKRRSKPSSMQPMYNPSGWLSAAETGFMENIQFGQSARQGTPPYMEDRLSCIPHFDELVRQKLCEAFGVEYEEDKDATPGQSFFGIFDGHGGIHAAEFCRLNMHDKIATEVANRVLDCYHAGRISQGQDALGTAGLLEAFTMGFQATETAFVQSAIEQQWSCGSTAVGVLLQGHSVHILHAGDCRAVLCSGGTASALTKDHSPLRYDEKLRVEKMGGFVEYGRLGGELGVTRAIGDVNPDTGQKYYKGLTSEPEHCHHIVQPADEFLLLACDGLWDVMDENAAVAFVRRSLNDYNDVQKTCEDLAAEAIRRYSEDNVTCIIVGFSKVDPFDGERKIIIPPRHSDPRREQFYLQNKTSPDKRPRRLSSVASGPPVATLGVAAAEARSLPPSSSSSLDPPVLQAATSTTSTTSTASTGSATSSGVPPWRPRRRRFKLDPAGLAKLKAALS